MSKTRIKNNKATQLNFMLPMTFQNEKTIEKKHSVKSSRDKLMKDLENQGLRKNFR